MTKQFKRKKLVRGQFNLTFQTKTHSSKETMSRKGLGHDSGRTAAPRLVTPPPASSDDAGERIFVHESSMHSLARLHHTATSAASPSSSRIQIKVDAPLPLLLVSLNAAGNESNSGSSTTISLGRSLHTNGIFRAPAANASANSNTAAGGASAAAEGGGGATSTATSPRDEDALYAFLKMPGLSHDTMENDTDNEEEDDDDGDTCACCYVNKKEEEEQGQGIVDIVYY